MRLRLKHHLALQFMRFLGVGAAATGFDYVVFLTALKIAHWPAVLASLIGYAAGGIVSYLLTRQFVFTSARSHKEAGLRFVLIMALGLLTTGVSMMILVDVMMIPPIFARLTTYAVVIIVNFLGHRLFTFSR
jgi:putative flippase GtrA